MATSLLTLIVDDVKVRAEVEVLAAIGDDDEAPNPLVKPPDDLRIKSRLAMQASRACFNRSGCLKHTCKESLSLQILEPVSKSNLNRSPISRFFNAQQVMDLVQHLSPERQGAGKGTAAEFAVPILLADGAEGVEEGLELGLDLSLGRGTLWDLAHHW